MSILSLFCGEFDKFNTTGVWMLDFICHMTVQILYNHIFCLKTKILLKMRRYYGHYYIMLWHIKSL